VLASLGFGFYVSNFGKYNATYGSLGGVIVFLLWLWITNLALLLGAEVDAELERARELQAGIPAERTLQLPPRDASGSDKARQAREKRVAEGRRLRREASAAAGIDGPHGGYSHDRGHLRHPDRPAGLPDVELEPLPSEVARSTGPPARRGGVQAS
jgi:membrane protein